MLLGALTKQLRVNGLINPMPTRPFLGHSIIDIQTLVRQFVSPNWAEVESGPQKILSCVGQMHTCKLGPFIDAAIKGVEDGIEGLILDDFNT